MKPKFKVGDIVFFDTFRHRYKIIEVVIGQSGIVTPALSYVIKSISGETEMRCYEYELQFADNGLEKALKRIMNENR